MWNRYKLTVIASFCTTISVSAKAEPPLLTFHSIPVTTISESISAVKTLENYKNWYHQGTLFWKGYRADTSSAWLKGYYDDVPSKPSQNLAILATYSFKKIDQNSFLAGASNEPTLFYSLDGTFKFKQNDSPDSTVSGYGPPQPTESNVHQFVKVDCYDGDDTSPHLVKSYARDYGNMTRRIGVETDESVRLGTIEGQSLNFVFRGNECSRIKVTLGVMGALVSMENFTFSPEATRVEAVCNESTDGDLKYLCDN